eukprot:1972071-Amphidinium_carterae.2
MNDSIRRSRALPSTNADAVATTPPECSPLDAAPTATSFPPSAGNCCSASSAAAASKSSATCVAVGDRQGKNKSPEMKMALKVLATIAFHYKGGLRVCFM